jgi:pimeloyl-ACP methyl ester carboxylesterase
VSTVEVPRETTRAHYPDAEGYVERDGVRVFYEVYGHGSPTVMLLPTWSLVHSRFWKAQIAYLARHFRVVVFDGRGNGRSDRPAAAAAYSAVEFAHDAFAVMDATETEAVVNVSTSAGTTWNLLMAARQPERVLGAAFLCPTTYAVAEPLPDWMHTPFNERLDGDAGATPYNRHFIRERYPEFARWWIELCTPEAHSSRSIEFGLEMAMETTPKVILATIDAIEIDRFGSMAAAFRTFGPLLRELAAQVRCPALVIHGELDAACPGNSSQALADDTGAELLVLPGTGHVPQGRKPVAVNLALRAFVERVAAG